MSNDRLSSIFSKMKDRCYNPNNKEFNNYGERGIKVCNEWYTPHSHKGYRIFKKWALENGYKDNLTIDRKDVNKGYSPCNCRWVTIAEQQSNKRNNRLIVYNGKTQTIAQWSKMLNIPYSTIKNRLNKGLQVEKILSDKNLCADRFENPEERKALSEKVKLFMSDREKKEKWKKSLSKRKSWCKNKKWFTNGIINVRSEDCPLGFYNGRSYKKIENKSL